MEDDQKITSRIPQHQSRNEMELQTVHARRKIPGAKRQIEGNRHRVEEKENIHRPDAQPGNRRIEPGVIAAGLIPADTEQNERKDREGAVNKENIGRQNFYTLHVYP